MPQAEAARSTTASRLAENVTLPHCSTCRREPHGLHIAPHCNIRYQRSGKRGAVITLSSATPSVTAAKRSQDDCCRLAGQLYQDTTIRTADTKQRCALEGTKANAGSPVISGLSLLAQPLRTPRPLSLSNRKKCAASLFVVAAGAGCLGWAPSNTATFLRLISCFPLVLR
jgi:hypothetical protein